MFPRLIVAALYLAVAQASAQDSLVVFRATAGSDVHAIAAITKITFTDTTIAFGGVAQSYPLSGLRKLSFRDAPQPVQRFSSTPVRSANRVEIGQWASSVLVKLQLAGPTRATIRICTLSGRTVKTIQHSFSDGGSKVIALQRDDFSVRSSSRGIYVINVSTAEGSSAARTINVLN